MKQNNIDYFYKTFHLKKILSFEMECKLHYFVGQTKINDNLL